MKSLHFFIKVKFSMSIICELVIKTIAVINTSFTISQLKIIELNSTKVLRLKQPLAYAKNKQKLYNNR